MTVRNSIAIIGELTGLGEQENVSDSFSTTTTVSAKAHVYQTQAVADTDEVLDLGGVTTPEVILIHCITNDVDIDTSYSAAFSAEITVNENEWAVFKPAGTVRIKNDDAGEQSVIEAFIWGT